MKRAAWLPPARGSSAIAIALSRLAFAGLFGLSVEGCASSEAAPATAATPPPPVGSVPAPSVGGSASASAPVVEGATPAPSASAATVATPAPPTSATPAPSPTASAPSPAVNPAAAPPPVKEVPIADGPSSEGIEGEDGDEGTASTPPAPTPTKPEEVVSVGSSKDLDVVARSLKLRKSSRDRLVAIAGFYKAQTGKKLTITGGDRDARTQAKLMYGKHKAGEDLLALYAKDALVHQILAAFDGKSGKKRSEKGAIDAITKVIETQMKHGEFVSRHLEFSAADVRSRDLRDADVAALRAAVNRVAGASIVDERDTSSPHLHLNL